MAETSYEMLVRRASKDGNVVFYGHKIPMQKFLADIEAFAAGLNALSLKKGDVVTVHLPSCPQGIVAFYACSKLGLVANMVHPLVPFKLLKKNLREVNSKALLFFDALMRDETELEQTGQILIRCSIADYVTVRKPLFKLYAKAIGKRLKSALTYRQLCKSTAKTEVSGTGCDVVCYMHSGGTSGTPKIVKLTNNAFNSTAVGMELMYHPDVDASCYNLATLPIFHAYGLCAGIHAPLAFGYSLVVVPKFDVKTVQKSLRKHKVTCWSVVPAMLKKLISAKKFDDKKALKDLDVIWCGGDVLDEALVEEVDAILQKYCARAKLMRGYGLTEVCGVCVVNNYDYYKKGSCGRPMPDCFAQIWDDDGNCVAPNEMGEIVVSAGGNMQGYMQGDCFAEKDGKQWVMTGDVGYLDEDGYLYIVDRKKRSIKIAAVNVFPSQIENCVKQLEFVDEACATGCVAHGKQYVKVFVTLKTPTDPDIVKEQVIEICKTNLIRYSVPAFVEVLEKMPRTPFGKIDYKSLEQALPCGH